MDVSHATHVSVGPVQLGMLPQWFARLHPRLRTPSNAVLFVGVLSAIAPLFGGKTLGWLVGAGGVAIILAIVLSLGLVVLFLPGMPSGLTWPYEWTILGFWALLGAIFFVRMLRSRHGNAPEPEHSRTPQVAPSHALGSEGGPRRPD